MIVEFTHAFTVALHFDGRKCLLRWNSDQHDQSRCPEVKCHYHSTNGTPILHLKSNNIRKLTQIKPELLSGESATECSTV